MTATSTTTTAAAARTVTVSGEIRTIASRQGSSGRFTGDICGLYQGYRFASDGPDERRCVVDVPYGQIAMVVRQEIVTPLPPRPAEHPFRDGEPDPFPPPPDPAHHRPAGSPPGADFTKVHYMKTTVRVDPDQSNGIFAGTTGEWEIEAPLYRMPGHLIVETDDGQLCLGFLEKGTRETLHADLWVDGERSTGKYRGAAGRLRFVLTVTPPFYGHGPYSGTLLLADGADQADQ
jgi:hypothetical protein